MSTGWKNALFYGDNLVVMRKEIKDESIDLIYLDPPFNSAANYNVLFKSKTGKAAQASIEAFEDTWHWTEAAEVAFDEVINSGHHHTADLLLSLRKFLGTNDMMAYVTMMAVRLIEMHRVLKETGSIYLHCDPTASHYLKLVMDSIFGVSNYRNEIVWLRSRNPKGSQYKNYRWGPATDTVLYYAKSVDAALDVDAAKEKVSLSDLGRKYPNEDENGRWVDGPILCSDSMGPRPNLVYEYKGFTLGPSGWRVNRSKLEEIDRSGDLYWTSEGRPRRKFRPSETELSPLGSCWDDIPPVNSQAQERLGYPTQKPLALLERIIKASSKPGDLILDPFCGCGTAVHAAEKLGRRWFGIDVTHLAIGLIERRMKDSFPGITFDVLGTPRDVDAARDLAERDKYQFQWWAVSLVDAQPFGGKKKGADGGIDGIIYFKTGSKTHERAIVSVKGGAHVGVGMIKDLRTTIENEKAPIGIFLTLAPPTGPMIAEAAKAGMYKTEWGDFPRIQILTIEELFAGKRPRMPLPDIAAAFKKAAKEQAADQQGVLTL